MGQRQGVFGNIAGGVGCLSLLVGRNHQTLGIGTQLVAQAVDKTQREAVLAAHASLVLESEIELIAVYRGFIHTRQRVYVGLAIAVYHISVIAAPEIRSIEAHRQTPKRLPASSDKDLMQAAVAAVAVGISGV